MITKKIRVYGIVQGVGFRPTVSRHAAAAGITGSVCNKGPYVEIFAQGEEKCVKDFLEKLEDIRNDYGSALRKILKFNEKTTGYIEKRKSEMNLPIDYIAVHIRRGDKIVSREMKELGLSLYIDAVKGKKHISRNVFIATDDGSVTDKLKSVLVAEGFNVYWNTAVTQTGFDESLFNTKDKKSRYIDTLNMLLDMDILIHSSFFIGTYTSNVSRIVPLYVGFDKSLSLDDEWKL